jgi:antirestriction protein
MRADKVADLAANISEHGEAYAAYVSYQGTDYADPKDFEERYQGEWDSEQAYAEHLIDEGVLGTIPKALANYIDTEKFAHDLFISDYWSIDAGGGRVYVFSH